jgi:queuine tRNA-ribosyltransferase
MHFELQHIDQKSGARAGILHTDHGPVETPIFMPVGTLGTVKSVHFSELESQINAQIILGNTYHLYLRPGMQVIEEAGGLHAFNSWKKPMLTDSGGFQVYSLAHRRKITEEGVQFQSHIDGSRHLFTPENVMDIQRTIGADIIMAFDECPAWPCKEDYARDSMHMTHRWLDRCFERFNETQPHWGHQQALFPIVQGSLYPDLRKASAEYCSDTESPGIAIGGLSVGEPAEEMYKMTGLVCDILPRERARYLMGVGTPANLLECIELGIDMFDCVMPTRNGRKGMLFTENGTINIRNAKWARDFDPIDATSPASTSREHSRAFLRHLIISGEYLGPQLGSIHNLAYYLQLVKQAREHILNDTFADWKAELVAKASHRL